MRVYLAASLFGVGEREFNERLASAIASEASDVEMILPQVKARQLDGAPTFQDEMFDYCIRTISQVDAVLAVLDGPDSDSGTCVECGYAYAKAVPIVGIRTDLRGSELQGLNLMVARVCQAILHDTRLRTSTEDVAHSVVHLLRRATTK